jgi:hypothetical protein
MAHENQHTKGGQGKGSRSERGLLHKTRGSGARSPYSAALS